MLRLVLISAAHCLITNFVIRNYSQVTKEDKGQMDIKTSRYQDVKTTLRRIPSGANS